VKRIIITLCVFLLLGAVVNVAVAWGFAWWANADGIKQAYGITTSQRKSIEIKRRDALGASWLVVTESRNWPLVLPETQRIISESPRAESIRPSWFQVVHATEELEALCRMYPTEYVSQRQIVFASGCPVRSIWCQLYFEFADPDSKTVRHVAGALFGPDDQTPVDILAPRLLPLRPIWPGFAINTLFYAAILWLLFTAPGSVRRWRRIRRGLCAKCAYPIGASDVCTECGAILKNRQTQASAPDVGSDG
jgi:hypothetical protein